MPAALFQPRILPAILACLLPWLAADPLAAQTEKRNFIELEIISQAGGPIGQNQKWLETLSEVGADSVRMGRTSGATRAGIRRTETASGATYKIIGLIDQKNRLILPAGKFSIRDTARIRAYLENIRADGAEVALAEKMAFGLTAGQLVNLHTHLSETYGDSTVDRTPQDVLVAVRRTCRTPIVIDPAASAALRGDYRLQDELKGLSHGTVLAAALRPLGLVLAPRREPGKDTEIVVTDSRRATEHWPIGWPLEQRPGQAIPKLFERIPVNIRNYTMKATLPAIQAALEVPFLFDYNSMAREGVDMENIRINVQSEKLSYQLILNRVVSQARPRMRMEIRADETGKPFIWFSAR